MPSITAALCIKVDYGKLVNATFMNISEWITREHFRQEIHPGRVKMVTFAAVKFPKVITYTEALAEISGLGWKPANTIELAHVARILSFKKNSALSNSFTLIALEGLWLHAHGPYATCLINQTGNIVMDLTLTRRHWDEGYSFLVRKN